MRDNNLNLMYMINIKPDITRYQTQRSREANSVQT